MKDVRVIKIVNAVMFKEVYGKSQVRKCLQRQKLTKYLRLTIILI